MLLVTQLRNSTHGASNLSLIKSGSGTVFFNIIKNDKTILLFPLPCNVLGLFFSIVLVTHINNLFIVWMITVII